MRYVIVDKLDEIRQNFYALIYDLTNNLKRATYHNKKILEYLKKNEGDCIRKNNKAKELNRILSKHNKQKKREA